MTGTEIDRGEETYESFSVQKERSSLTYCLHGKRRCTEIIRSGDCNVESRGIYTAYDPISFSRMPFFLAKSVRAFDQP